MFGQDDDFPLPPIPMHPYLPYLPPGSVHSLPPDEVVHSIHGDSEFGGYAGYRRKRWL